MGKSNKNAVDASKSRTMEYFPKNFQALFHIQGVPKVAQRYNGNSMLFDSAFHANLIITRYASAASKP